MHTAQWEFGFGEMTKIGTPIRLKGSGPRLSLEDRDALIIDLRRKNWSYKRIKSEARCSKATVLKVLRRDAPDLAGAPRQTPKEDPRTKAELLALPPTDDEPLAKIGIHFWDMPVRGACRFIVAKDPDDKLARFCGDVTAASGCSWCATHLRVVAMPRKLIAEAA